MCDLNLGRQFSKDCLCVFVLGLLAFGCGESGQGNDGVPLVLPDAGVSSDMSTVALDLDVEDASDPIAGRFKLLDPVTGRGVSNVTVSLDDQEAVTDAQGEAVLQIGEGPYAIRMTKSGVRPHTIFGVAGREGFTQVSYFSSEQITRAVFGSLGIQDEPEKGIVVVGLDLPNLAPAVGASASLDTESGDAFVLSQTGALRGDTIEQGQLGFVTFPNVNPGIVDVTVSYAEGACAVFPAESGVGSLAVEPGEVRVMAYTCR